MKRYFADKVAADTIRYRADQASIAEAIAIVDAFNARLAEKRPLQFSPTIGAAVCARKPFLKIYCPGCQQITDIDLREIVRPADFPIMSLRAALVCESLCRGQGPQPQLIALVELPEDVKKITYRDRA